MKWSIVCLLLTVATIGSIQTIEGGTESLINARDPFYSTAGYCGININLYSPVDGTTYYTNNILLNFSVTGSDNCFYNLGTGWYSIDCNYEDVVTFSNGEQTLTLRGVNDICVVDGFITYTVDTKTEPWGYLSYFFFTCIFIACIFLLLWLHSE